MESKRYLIKINYGFGDEFEEIEAENQDDADERVYALWLENAEAQSHYEAREMTPELEEDMCY